MQHICSNSPCFRSVLLPASRVSDVYQSEYTFKCHNMSKCVCWKMKQVDWFEDNSRNKYQKIIFHVYIFSDVHCASLIPIYTLLRGRGGGGRRRGRLHVVNWDRAKKNCISSRWFKKKIDKNVFRETFSHFLRIFWNAFFFWSQGNDEKNSLIWLYMTFWSNCQEVWAQNWPYLKNINRKNIC